MEQRKIQELLRFWDRQLGTSLPYVVVYGYKGHNDMFHSNERNFRRLYDSMNTEVDRRNLSLWMFASFTLDIKSGMKYMKDNFKRSINIQKLESTSYEMIDSPFMSFKILDVDSTGTEEVCKANFYCMMAHMLFLTTKYQEGYYDSIEKVFRRKLKVRTTNSKNGLFTISEKHEYDSPDFCNLYLKANMADIKEENFQLHIGKLEDLWVFDIEEKPDWKADDVPWA